MATSNSQSDSYLFMVASRKVDAALGSLQSLQSRLFGSDIPALLSTMEGGSRPYFEQACARAQQGVQKLISSLSQVNQKIDATGKADQAMKQSLHERGRATVANIPELNVRYSINTHL